MPAYDDVDPVRYRMQNFSPHACYAMLEKNDRLECLAGTGRLRSSRGGRVCARPGATTGRRGSRRGEWGVAVFRFQVSGLNSTQSHRDTETIKNLSYWTREKSFL